MEHAEALARSAWRRLFAAWLVAAAATLGALFVGEVMGQAPCALCWYQRAFMFPLAIVLGIAAMYEDRGVVRYALPLATLGGLVAGYHVLVYFGLVAAAIVPCTAAGPSCGGAAMTVLGGVPLPLLSLLAFALIAGLLILFRRPLP